MAKLGSFTLVLHAHLPYVLSHGRWPHGVDWLNEAAAECYMPLLDMFNSLVEEGISPRVTVGLTPVLVEQLADPLFDQEFESYLGQKIAAAEEDEREFSRIGESDFSALASMWRDHYRGIWERRRGRYAQGLVEGFRRLQDEGHLEIITSAATHGYLPLLAEETSVYAQVRVGIESYQRRFGRRARGMWLPECAYRPGYRWTSPIDPGAEPVDRRGLEEFVRAGGIDYFIIDSHLLKGGQAIGVYLDRFDALRTLWERYEEAHPPRPEAEENSPYEIYLVGTAPDKEPVAILTRDPSTALQVWSSEHGYPGDEWYLDFHKRRFPGGHRYWRVSASGPDLALKQTYRPGRVEKRLRENADHFVGLIKRTLAHHFEKSGRPGSICAPFDAELFGHWWFEGPRWLGYVIRLIAQDPDLELRTGAEQVDAARPSVVVSLPEGSWGEGGFHWIWLNERTRWTWSHIYEAEHRMRALVARYGSKTDRNVRRLLVQLARELLLLESSDWQFLISTWSARDYAELRLDGHYRDFRRLAELVEKCGEGGELSPEEWAFMAICEERDGIFSGIDPEWWGIDVPGIF
ncbi:hypothetical protein AMJ71_09985 [candidate division TA06 bacterium SM1_40]|uniref:Glycoside hydrolase n=2 Tax=Bacteria division TA06 TaxID=1156500 RepID=A0A0S8JAI2_UNCT6|nr:MAG: hypothetical protein AMJ82_06255 [candidate division TA06 bacterium SM23_40]KPL06338.1 MAG: hypothetical protein AMJ71_09985 [candidate division TA06 bacterium SM1_40]